MLQQVGMQQGIAFLIGTAAALFICVWLVRRRSAKLKLLEPQAAAVRKGWRSYHWAIGLVLVMTLHGMYRAFTEQKPTTNGAAARQESNARVTPVAAVVQNLGVMSRQDFNSAVTGRSEADVIAAVGRPQQTSENTMYGARVGFWTYNDRTMDAITQKVDGAVIVQFKNGRAESTLY